MRSGRRHPSNGCGPAGSVERARTLQSLVAHYVSETDACADDLAYYREAPTWREALRRAAFCERRNDKGKIVRHGHQPARYFRQEVLAEAHEALRRADLRSASDFHDLLTRVEATVSDIPGIGELYVYDVAHRIGAWMKPRLRPRFVYLHAGTRKGAQALGMEWRNDKLAKKDLPPELHRLHPEQVEDFLCNCKHQLALLAGTIGRK